MLSLNSERYPESCPNVLEPRDSLEYDLNFLFPPTATVHLARARGVRGAREGRIQYRASTRTGWTTGTSSSDAIGMSISCPVCSCPTYSSVVVPRPKGGTYTTSLFACTDCTTMFLDRAKYTRTPKPQVVPIAPDLPTGWLSTRRAGRPAGAHGVADLAGAAL